MIQHPDPRVVAKVAFQLAASSPDHRAEDFRRVIEALVKGCQRCGWSGQETADYITAYGNNEALMVKKGDAVKKGQTIAKAGNSGGAASPRLHFEVRRGGSKTVDPMTVLPAQ